MRVENGFRSEAFGWDIIFCEGFKRWFGNVTERSKAAAGDFPQMRSELSCDGFRHGAAAGVTQTNKKYAKFFAGLHLMKSFSQKGLREANFGSGGCGFGRVRGNHLKEMSVDGRVRSKFGMKRGSEEILVLYKDGFAGVFGEDFEGVAGTFDDGAADEDHLHRSGFEFARAEEDVAGDLAAVRVAENRHVHKAKRGLRGIFDFGGEQDRPSAGAKNGAAGVCEVSNSVVEAFFLEKLELRCAFTARKDKAVALFQVCDGADFERLRAEFAEARGVGFEVTLNGENSYLQSCLV